MLKISPLKTTKLAVLTFTIIALAVIFGIFAVQRGSPEKESSEFLSEKSEFQQPTYSTPPRFIGSNKTLEKIGQTAPLPVVLKPVALQDIRETIGEFAEKSGIDAFGALAPVGNTPAIVGVQAPSAVSDESLPLLFPETYIIYVTTIRDLMRERGVLGQNEFAAFATNDDVLNFLPRILDFAANEGWITQTQAENYKQNLAPGFAAMKAEYLQFRSSSAATKKFASACSAPIENESSRRITDIFEKYFFGWMKEAATFAKIPVAEAFVPLCYKDHDPSGIIPGYNVPGILCCNCGWKRIPVPPFVVFVPVCDPPVSVGGYPITPLCDIPSGCLNLVCGWMPNAIWDPTTGICGCG